MFSKNFDALYTLSFSRHFRIPCSTWALGVDGDHTWLVSGPRLIVGPSHDVAGKPFSHTREQSQAWRVCRSLTGQ
jgi:hypothetical protein